MIEEDATLDVVCDLRQLQEDIKDIGTLQRLWQEAGAGLVGQIATVGQALEVLLPTGRMLLWVVNTPVQKIEASTAFQVIDVLRSPTLLYRCRECGQYGPFRCAQCEAAQRPARLCSTHAYSIEDELTSYCSEHLPSCNCRPGCSQKATFRCARCHKLFGNHVLYKNPRYEDTAYCQSCYQNLFEQCGECLRQGQSRLGKAKCAFQKRGTDTRCETPLCWEHSYQWKIWGPHNRGVTLCGPHKQQLGSTDPGDLLYMMLTARAPYARRGKRQSLPNPFRLRRILNRNRTSPLNFVQITQALRAIESQVAQWGHQAKHSYDYIMQNFNDTVSRLPQDETALLMKVKAFYERELGWAAASSITRLEITDRYYKPGQPAQDRILLTLNTSNKGPYIGPRGSVINRLCAQLNIKVDLQ